MANEDKQVIARQSGVGRLRRGRKPLRIRQLNAIAIIAAAILSLSALVAVDHIFETEAASEQANAAYRECSSAARDLQEASDYLTSQVRVFVSTGNRTYMDDYLEEIHVTDRRGKAVQTLKDHLQADQSAVTDLEQALTYSNELAVRELYAMKLVTTALGMQNVPQDVAQVELSQEDLQLSAQEQQTKAEQMVLGDEYQATKYQISNSVKSCSTALFNELNSAIEANNESMHSRLGNMQVVVVALLVLLVSIIFATIFLVLWPLASYTRQIARDERLILTGASELRYLADAYNTIWEENRQRTLHLRNAAERDGLTGLYNRGAYDTLLSENAHDIALLIIDVDYFKNVNDTYGHAVGDAVLKKVAHLITHTFRSSDFPCRFGGDEFAVIMTDITPDLRHVVVDKVEHIAHALLDTSDGLPQVTLSVGIAFSGSHEGIDDINQAADKALYVVKERGRNGYAFYGEE